MGSNKEQRFLIAWDVKFASECSIYFKHRNGNCQPEHKQSSPYNVAFSRTRSDSQHFNDGNKYVTKIHPLASRFKTLKDYKRKKFKHKSKTTLLSKTNQ